MHAVPDAAAREPRELQRGSHPLGLHAWLVVETGRACLPSVAPEQARGLLEAVLQCIDLVGGTAQASRPQAAAPAHPPTSGRTRATTNNPDRAKLRALPMNPGAGHHASAGSQPPPSDLDSSYWRREYTRVTDHADRCEAVRRAADYLASLICAPAPQIDRDGKPIARGVFTDDDLREQALVEGHGWPLVDVARKLHVTERFVALARIDDGRHPLTGKKWTPPKDNQIAAHQARAMRDVGLTSTDIAAALERSASAVRMWTTQARRAA